MEACIMNALEQDEHVFKLTVDINLINTALLEYHLLPINIQQKIQDCNITDKSLRLCEEKYGPGNCEQNGVVYLKKCPDDFVRLDVGVCGRECPSDTMEDAIGFMCAKPKIIKK